MATTLVCKHCGTYGGETSVPGMANWICDDCFAAAKERQRKPVKYLPINVVRTGHDTPCALRTAQDADNALLVRATMEGHVACVERLGAIQRVVTMTSGEVFHVKLVNGDYLLTKSIRAALRRALGEET